MLVALQLQAAGIRWQAGSKVRKRLKAPLTATARHHPIIGQCQHAIMIT